MRPHVLLETSDCRHAGGSGEAYSGAGGSWGHAEGRPGWLGVPRRRGPGVIGRYVCVVFVVLCLPPVSVPAAVCHPAVAPAAERPLPRVWSAGCDPPESTRPSRVPPDRSSLAGGRATRLSGAWVCLLWRRGSHAGFLRAAVRTVAVPGGALICPGRGRRRRRRRRRRHGEPAADGRAASVCRPAASPINLDLCRRASSAAIAAAAAAAAAASVALRALCRRRSLRCYRHRIKQLRHRHQHRLHRHH